MEQKQRDVVYGYVRLNYKETFIMDIIEIIYQFYLIKIDSNILNSNEKLSLLNLLFDALKKQTGNEEMKNIDTKLLYRASENDRSAEKFHDLCEGEGATITIIHNEHDHVFGGYTSKSWPKCDIGYTNWTWYEDSNAFLFMIRPKCKVFALKSNLSDEDKKGVIHACTGYGPIFGNGWDIYIGDKGNQHGGTPSSFTHTSQEMCGAKIEDQWHNYTYKILDYEVFSITTK